MAAARPGWDQYFLQISDAVAKRADCTRRQVGAVIVGPDRQIISTGYNGAPAGRPGCLTAGACPRGQLTKSEVAPGSSYDTGAGACIALHAEQNAVIRAGTRAVGSHMYITDEPCDGCKRLIEGAGIMHVIWYTGDWYPKGEPKSSWLERLKDILGV